MMWALLRFKPIPGAQTGAFANLIAAVFVIVFGFLFVTVASRISGLIGNSSNPISGMTIATLMATCAVFLVIHWTANAYAVLALTIGGVVCIAAAIAGATSQDLKTGYLVGATPYPAADRAARRRAGFFVRHWRHADPDEHRPRAVQAAADSSGHQQSARRASSVRTTPSQHEGKILRAGELRSDRAKCPTENICTIPRRIRSKCSGCRESAAIRRRLRRRG